MRVVLAVLAGLVSGSLVVSLCEWLSHRLYPLPPLDFNDPEALRAAVATLPTAALVLVVMGWMAGTYAGARIGAAIAPTHKTLVTGLVGGLFLAATLSNLYMIPHPTWMTLAGPAAVLVAAWLASRSVTPTGVRV